VLFPKRVHERVLLSVNAAQHSFVTNLFFSSFKRFLLPFFVVFLAKEKKQKKEARRREKKRKAHCCVKGFTCKTKNESKKTSFSMG
jgi:hypothetical protein